MKRLPLILNAVLIIAVAVLYLLHFTSGKSNSSTGGSIISMPGNFQGSLKIAYVNIDTLMSKFSLYNQNQQKLADRQKKAEAQLNEKGSQFQSHYNDFQNKVNKGLITTADAQEMQKQLTEEQQNLYKLNDQLRQDLTEEGQVMTRQVLDEIESYLKEYTKDHPYSYIMSYSFGSAVLYANDSLDITNDVLQKLNEKFKNTEKSKK